MATPDIRRSKAFNWRSNTGDSPWRAFERQSNAIGFLGRGALAQYEIPGYASDGGHCEADIGHLVGTDLLRRRTRVPKELSTGDTGSNKNCK
jgi:hypothetical protein